MINNNAHSLIHHPYEVLNAHFPNIHSHGREEYALLNAHVRKIIKFEREMDTWTRKIKMKMK